MKMPRVKGGQLKLEDVEKLIAQLQEQERRKYEAKIKSLEEELAMVKRRSRKQILECTIAREKDWLKRFSKDIIVRRGWIDAIPLRRWKEVTINNLGVIVQLNLSFLGITDAMIQQVRFPSGLKVLELWHNKIGDEGVKGLVLPPGLEKLSLLWNRIGDEGAKGLELPRGLERLFLSCNRIGDEGAKGLELPGGLKKLYLYGNKIGAEGARGLNLPGGLQELDLDENRIGGEGGKRLVLPRGLEKLRIGKEQYTNIGECCVCFEVKCLKRLGCEHVLCYECTEKIQGSVSLRHSCPVCRAPM